MIRLGDGPEKTLVDNLILHYIRQEEVIIIPVVPCNVDLDTSACLNLALEHDPSGERTIVTLTKVDLIDKGNILHKKRLVISFLNLAKVLLSLGKYVH